MRYVMPDEYGFVKLTHAEARPDHTLLLTFETGEKKLYDFKPKLALKIYDKLKNPGFFIQARKMSYAVVWNDDIDIASEELYYNGIPCLGES
jgi:hypothetical protein